MTSVEEFGALKVADVPRGELNALLALFRLRLIVVGDDEPITASYWGEPEAGIVARDVYVRGDTPIHSLLHEMSHVVCMSEKRRESLDRDAGGDDLEEAAVCLMQIVLADHIAGVGGDRIMRDMDAWGYSFRLGRTQRWFEEDAEDARRWLIGHDLLTPDGDATFALRA